MNKFVLRQEGENDEDAQAKAVLLPGMKLYGFMCGLFGRDSYGTKTILSVHHDHIVAREDGHTIVSRTVDGRVYTWAGVIQDSNDCLKELEEERERE